MVKRKLQDTDDYYKNLLGAFESEGEEIDSNFDDDSKDLDNNFGTKNHQHEDIDNNEGTEAIKEGDSTDEDPNFKDKTRATISNNFKDESGDVISDDYKWGNSPDMTGTEAEDTHVHNNKFDSNFDDHSEKNDEIDPNWSNTKELADEGGMDFSMPNSEGLYGDLGDDAEPAIDRLTPPKEEAQASLYSDLGSDAEKGFDQMFGKDKQGNEEIDDPFPLEEKPMDKIQVGGQFNNPEEPVIDEAVGGEMEMCTCGHLGGATDPAQNKHEDRIQQGHGGCTICGPAVCPQFTWTTMGEATEAEGSQALDGKTIDGNFDDESDGELDDNFENDKNIADETDLADNKYGSNKSEDGQYNPNKDTTGITNKAKADEMYDLTTDPSHGVGFRCNCGAMITEKSYESHMKVAHEGDAWLNATEFHDVPVDRDLGVISPDEDEEQPEDNSYNADPQHEIGSHMVQSAKGQLSNVTGAKESFKKKELATEVEQEEVSRYLDELRESGVTNMFGAGPYVEQEFLVSKDEARQFVQYWMQNFGSGEAFSGEGISDEFMSKTWDAVNQISPSHWDGWFGMEKENWDEAGVTEQDDPQTVMDKVDRMIEMKLDSHHPDWWTEGDEATEGALRDAITGAWNRMDHDVREETANTAGADPNIATLSLSEIEDTHPEDFEKLKMFGVFEDNKWASSEGLYDSIDSTGMGINSGGMDIVDPEDSADDLGFGDTSGFQVGKNNLVPLAGGQEEDDSNPLDPRQPAIGGYDPELDSDDPNDEFTEEQGPVFDDASYDEQSIDDIQDLGDMEQEDQDSPTSFANDEPRTKGFDWQEGGEQEHPDFSDERPVYNDYDKKSMVDVNDLQDEQEDELEGGTLSNDDAVPPTGFGWQEGGEDQGDIYSDYDGDPVGLDDEEEGSLSKDLVDTGRVDPDEKIYPSDYDQTKNDFGKSMMMDLAGGEDYGDDDSTDSYGDWDTDRCPNCGAAGDSLFSPVERSSEVGCSNCGWSGSAFDLAEGTTSNVESTEASYAASITPRIENIEDEGIDPNEDEHDKWGGELPQVKDVAEEDAYWSGDNNNPNRDLSDPSWVSVDGHRAMQGRRRDDDENYSQEQFEAQVCPLCGKTFKFNVGNQEDVSGSETEMGDHMKMEHNADPQAWAEQQQISFFDGELGMSTPVPEEQMGMEQDPALGQPQGDQIPQAPVMGEADDNWHRKPLIPTEHIGQTAGDVGVSGDDVGLPTASDTDPASVLGPEAVSEKPFGSDKREKGFYGIKDYDDGEDEAKDLLDSEETNLSEESAISKARKDFNILGF